MAKTDSFRRLLLGIVVMVLLTGAVVTMYWYVWAPSTPAPPDPSQPLEASALVQLEAPPDEVDLHRDAVLAKDGGESEWVESGNPESVPPLIQYLKSQEELVQLAALAEFAGMGVKAKKAVPAVVEALEDPKGSIRVKAAVTLIQMNGQAKAAVRA